MVVKNNRYYLTSIEVEKIKQQLYYKQTTFKEIALQIGISNVYLSRVVQQKSSINGKIYNGIKEILGIEL